jgi:WD40 repeat protein
VVDKLAGARLITLGHNSVEIAHEALIRHWPRLREWLADDREGHRLRRQLTEAAIEWEHHDQDDGLLYRGARLVAWQDRPLNQLNSSELTFLNTSRSAVDREHRQRRRRVRLTISGLGSATVIVTVLAVIALMMATRANNERELAVSRQLVADAHAQLQLDPELGLLLAREAYAALPNDETENVLRQAIADSHLRFTLPKAESQITGVTFSSDGKHLATTTGSDGAMVWAWDAERRTWTMSRRSVHQPSFPHGPDLGVRLPDDGVTVDEIGSMHSPTFSPDNRRIAMISVEGVVSVWDWVGRAEPVTVGGNRASACCTNSVALGPDGQRLTRGGMDGVIEVWDTPGDDQPDLLPGHVGPVSGLTFSPDGTLLASSGDDGTVRIWNLVAGGIPIVLRGHEGSVRDVAFSPDGRQVTTTGVDNTVRVWDADGAADSVVLGSHDGTGFAVAFSKDGRLIASAGADNIVRIWNADHRAAPTVLRGHRGDVYDVAFSPDSRSVVSASQDGTAKIWDVEAVEDMTVLRGHEGTVSSVTPSPDGRRIASGGQDGTVRIWDIASKRAQMVLREHKLPVQQVIFSHDGRYLVTVDQGGTVLVWNTHDFTKPEQLATGPKDDVAFSPDGKRLAVLGFNSLSIWDLAGPRPLEHLTGLRTSWPTFVSMKVAWSPDGHHLAASSEEDVVQLWDLRTGADPTLLPGQPDLSRTLAISPDGTHLASGGVDGSVNLWNITTGPTRPVVLHGHQGEVWYAAFSPDSRHLITSGNDGTVRIWKTGGNSEPLVLSGFRASNRAVVPMNNSQYTTAHDDGTIRIWRCPACGPITEVLASADQRVTRELTPEERQTYLPAA